MYISRSFVRWNKKRTLEYDFNAFMNKISALISHVKRVVFCFCNGQWALTRAWWSQTFWYCEVQNSFMVIWHNRHGRGSIFCNPTQLNPSLYRPNPTHDLCSHHDPTQHRTRRTGFWTTFCCCSEQQQNVVQIAKKVTQHPTVQFMPIETLLLCNV